MRIRTRKTEYIGVENLLKAFEKGSVERSCNSGNTIGRNGCGWTRNGGVCSRKKNNKSSTNNKNQSTLVRFAGLLSPFIQAGESLATASGRFSALVSFVDFIFKPLFVSFESPFAKTVTSSVEDGLWWECSGTAEGDELFA